MESDKKHLEAFDGDSPKVRETKKRIAQCLFVLMERDSIDRITVAEVCAAARINRSTFYNHFDGIYDVRAVCEDRIEREVRQVIPFLMGKVLLGDGELAVSYFEEHMAPYYDYLNVLLNGGDPAFVMRMRDIAHDSLQDTLHINCFSEHQELVFNAVAGMQIGIIGRWLSSGRAIPLADLLDLIGLLVREGPRAALLQEQPGRR
jgi:AcrR family transcriptional regulator